MAARSPLDLDRDTMRRLGHRVADVVAEHLSTLREQPVIASMDRRDAAEVLGGPPPEHGTGFDALLDTLRDDAFRWTAREPHPGFMAYVPSCPTFPAILGDWLATGHNFFAGVWPVGSGVAQLELLVLDWFRAWLGMPEGSSGLLTTGGSAANLTAVVAARHEAVGDDPSRLARLAVYTSDQAHSSVMRGAWIAGVPRANVRSIESDEGFRMRTGALEAAIARDRRDGLVPLMVVASAGTTNTGAVDPLHEVADLCSRERVWMHVDAAYGGFAVLTDRGRTALDGIARADSVTLDPHKWLFVPFECGCLLVRDPRRLREAFRILPEYLRDADAAGGQVNFADYGEQLTRYARALKVWLGVRYFGVAALRDAVLQGIERAQYAERLVRAEPELELLAPATLGICCFRAHPRGIDDPIALDALNERINTTVSAAGRHFISSTRLRGTFSLRVCPIGYRTTMEDIADLVRTIAELARSTPAGAAPG